MLPRLSKMIINNALLRMQQFSQHSLDCHQQDLVCIINKWCHAVDAVPSTHLPSIYLAAWAVLKNSFEQALCAFYSCTWNAISDLNYGDFHWLQFLTPTHIYACHLDKAFSQRIHFEVFKFLYSIVKAFRLQNDFIPHDFNSFACRQTWPNRQPKATVMDLKLTASHAERQCRWW